MFGCRDYYLCLGEGQFTCLTSVFRWLTPFDTTLQRTYCLFCLGIKSLLYSCVCVCVCVFERERERERERAFIITILSMRACVCMFSFSSSSFLLWEEEEEEG